MLLRASPLATHPLQFGKNARSFFRRCSSAPWRPHELSEDLRLFALTFASGFIAVSVLIA